MDTIIDRYPDSNLKILTDHLARVDNPSVTDFINELASMHLEYPEWSDNRLELTQLQAACLVARSMCCVLGEPYDCIYMYNRMKDPRAPMGTDPQSFYASIANTLDPDDVNWLSSQKIRALYCYFEQCLKVGIDSLSGLIVVRKSNDTIDFSSIETKPMSNSTIRSGYMDVSSKIKVDFANKNIGGGILNHGCCQEEIMFCQHPELIALMSLVDTLGPHEAVVVSGVTWYVKTSGYGFDMRFIGPTSDVTDRDPLTIIMMDAIDYRGNPDMLTEQYKPENKRTELQKVINAFKLVGPGAMITTGEWGCGAFGGDSSIKYLIQWVAATITGNHLHYHARNTGHLHCLSSKYSDHDIGVVLDCVLSRWCRSDYSNPIFSEGSQS